MTFLLFTSLIVSYGSIAQDLRSETSINFEINNLGINVDGKFTEASINTNFNNDDVSKWTLFATVNVSSITTDNNRRDEHLLSNDYFDVSTYPKISLKATNFKQISKNNYDVTVNLIIKKITKTITIPIQIIKADKGLSLTTYFELNRGHYGVGRSSFILSKTLKINVYYNLRND